MVGAAASVALMLTGVGPGLTWPSGDTPPVKTLTGFNSGLSYSNGVAFDPAGRMYVTNFDSNSVSVYAADWASGNTAPVKTLSGQDTGLSSPTGLAIDSAGQLYVTNSEFEGDSVTVYAADWAGGNTAPVKTLTGSNTGLKTPSAVAFDRAGQMYVSNYDRDSVTVYAAGWADGNTAPVKTLTGLSFPSSVAFDSADQMYVASFGAGTLVPGSVTVYAADWASGNPAPVKTLTGQATRLRSPDGVAFDTAGQMYITNFQSNAVTVYAAGWADGNTAPVKALAGKATGLNSPSGPVAFDAAGQMYVANAAKNMGLPSVTVYASSQQKTQLTVIGKPAKALLPVQQRSVLVSSMSTDAATHRATAWCELRGTRLPARVAKRLCGITVTTSPPVQTTGGGQDVRSAAPARVRVTAKPACSARLTVHAQITAKKQGATRTTWTRSWKVAKSPFIRCASKGTG